MWEEKFTSKNKLPPSPQTIQKRTKKKQQKPGARKEDKPKQCESERERE